MKNIITFTIILMALTACSVFQVQAHETAGTEVIPNMPNPAAVDCEIGKQLVIQTAADGSQSIECVDPDGSAPSMPNPASVYCEENGNQLEIQTAADGGQTGVCIFPDGSVCEEWVYFRGECGPTPAATDEASGGGPGESGGTVVDGLGGYMPPGSSEEIANWRGIIKSTEPGAQYDDYFELWTNGQIIYFGIDSMDPVVQAQFEALRDSGKIVHLYGTLLSNVPDYNGSQIQVVRIGVE